MATRKTIEATIDRNLAATEAMTPLGDFTADGMTLLGLVAAAKRFADALPVEEDGTSATVFRKAVEAAFDAAVTFECKRF